MDCKGCKDKQTNPYFSADAGMAHLMRVIKWLVIIIIVQALIIVGSYVMFTKAWTSYDYSGTSTEEITVDGESGAASYVGGDNSGRLIINGENNGTENEDQPPD